MKISTLDEVRRLPEGELLCESLMKTREFLYFCFREIRPTMDDYKLRYYACMLTDAGHLIGFLEYSIEFNPVKQQFFILIMDITPMCEQQIELSKVEDYLSDYKLEIIMLLKNEKDQQFFDSSNCNIEFRKIGEFKNGSLL